MQKDGKRRDDAFAAPPVQRVKAVTGQLLSWRLVLTNRSKLPVAGARISVMLPDVPERKGSRAALCATNRGEQLQISVMTSTVADLPSHAHTCS